MKWRLTRNDAPAEARRAQQFAQQIMPRVSRTFAVGTSVLSGDLYWAVCVGYLMCRIADTIEDDGSTDPSRRQQLLARFVETFDDEEIAARFGAEAADIAGNPAHLELLANTGAVMTVLRHLPQGSSAIVKRWTREMVGGMSEFVGRYPAGIRIQTMAEYRRYCYFVAGTVGHMLSDLWFFHSPAVHRSDYQRLLVDCEAFGEALQTINIIKDIPWDIEHENSAYIPEELLKKSGSSHDDMLDEARRVANRDAIDALIALAREDVRRSMLYINNIPKAAFRIRLFCLLPVLFAVATLREIEQSTAMLKPGGAVKISRREVRALILAGTISTVSNTTTRWLVDTTSRTRFAPGLAK